MMLEGFPGGHQFGPYNAERCHSPRLLIVLVFPWLARLEKIILAVQEISISQQDGGPQLCLPSCRESPVSRTAIRLIIDVFSSLPY